MPVNYPKTVWEDRVVQYPRRYTESEQAGGITHTPAPGVIVKKGTPVKASIMNNIENGIEACAALANDLEQNKIGQAIYRATIPTTNWTGASAPFTRVVNVTGVRDSDTPIIDIVLTGNYAADAEIADAWTGIQRIVAGDNRLIITADEIPEVEIPIQVRCLR